MALRDLLKVLVRITGARGPIGLDIEGDPADRAGKLVQFVAGGSGRRVAPVAGGGADNTLRADLASSTGDFLVTSKLAGVTGAVEVTQGDINRERVNITRFGAVCDGATDDRAAIQAAVNYCLAVSPPRSLEWPAGAVSYVSASIMIERFVDTTEGQFHIYGNGGGVVTDQPIVLFDTTLRKPYDPDTGRAADIDPCSENIVWHEFIWQCTDADVAAYALGWRFLRIGLMGYCEARRIKLVDCPVYMQDWFSQYLVAREWKGWFVKSHSNWFDCDFTVRLENAPAGDGFLSEEGGMFGSRIAGLMEGIRNGFQQAGAVKGEIQVYFEGNTGVDITMTDISQGGAASSMDLQTIHVVTGANAADADYYPIITGDIRNCTFRCESNINLIDNTHAIYPIDVSNCFSATGRVYPGAGKSGTVKGDPGIRTDLFDTSRTGPTRAILGSEGYLNFGGWYASYTGLWARFGLNGQNVPFAGYSVCPEGIVGEYVMATHGPANPQTGYYGAAAFKKGDVVWNSKPDVGEPAGWMCVTAGAPGTWAAMANLA